VRQKGRNSCVLPLTVTDPCLEVTPYMTFEGDCVVHMGKHADDTAEDSGWLPVTREGYCAAMATSSLFTRQVSA
jgi:hypothetical protein